MASESRIPDPIFRSLERQVATSELRLELDLSFTAEGLRELSPLWDTCPASTDLRFRQEALGLEYGACLRATDVMLFEGSLGLRSLVSWLAVLLGACLLPGWLAGLHGEQGEDLDVDPLETVGFPTRELQNYAERWPKWTGPKLKL